MSTNLIQQTLSAILFFCFGSLILGYELGNWIANSSWRFNGLLIIASCVIFYGCQLLRPAFKQLEHISTNN